MKEIWKTINNFPDYKISNLGLVKSFKYDKLNGRLLSLKSLDKDGYLLVGLSKIKTKTCKIHRLVAEHFLDDWNPKLTVDHIDGNKQNNKSNNLRMCTQKKNVNYYSNSKIISKYRGVTWNKINKYWTTQIHKNNKNHYIGSFKSEIEASKAYSYAKEFGVEAARDKFMKYKKEK